MGRQRKFKKIKLPSIVEEIRDIAVKNLVGFATALLVAFTMLLLVKAFLYNSDYFKLKSVETKSSFIDHGTAEWINNEMLRLYKDKNVFKINLKNAARMVQASYPDSKEVDVRIALPDKLLISLKFRRPVALIRDERYYPIDEEGYVLPSVDARSLKELPVILGVDVRYDARRGRRNTSRNLDLALSLLKAVKKFKFLDEYGVNTINADDVKNMTFYLKTGTEIRIGPEDFEGRLSRLEKTLKDQRLVFDKIKYIDVRFKDVIIGPK
ncbi:MAG: cell division protein FtsQ/DivIB [bacterium]|nr:cell division protein FtsQ/DivIB [bacterium]